MNNNNIRQKHDILKNKFTYIYNIFFFLDNSIIRGQIVRFYYGVASGTKDNVAISWGSNGEENLRAGNREPRPLMNNGLMGREEPFLENFLFYFCIVTKQIFFKP